MSKTISTAHSTPIKTDAADLIRHRRQAYLNIFDKDSPHTRAVLHDLAHFCRATKTPFDRDPAVQNILIGRLEVFRRISEHLNLSEAELYDIYVNGK